jgi:hypothetical protein
MDEAHHAWRTSLSSVTVADVRAGLLKKFQGPARP